MRKLVVAIIVVASALAWRLVPVSAVGAELASATAAPTASITLDGSVADSSADQPFQGVGAVLGGGGNARYLMDYPQPERGQILDYLFKPGYGASLQTLKLEIGGGTNSSDGSEASIEPSLTQPINCYAGYEFAIAQQAVQLNSSIALYGLQWSAPSWVGQATPADSSASPDSTLFTGSYSPATSTSPPVETGDIKYLIDYVNCAKNTWGLHISYLGGWNENSFGSTYPWYQTLRAALDGNGYGQYESDGVTPNPWYVQLIAGDLNPHWEYVPSSGSSYSAISVLGAHDICGNPTELPTSAGTLPTCEGPATSSSISQPLWASELGRMDAGAESNCGVQIPASAGPVIPCAPAMDRALTRGYLEAGLTGYLEWPVLDAMPETGSSTEDETPLPYENRGLITADEPWSGDYSVRAMTWAIAQFTDFVGPADSNGTWLYQKNGTAYLNGSSTNGAYVTFVHNNGSAIDMWTTVIDATTATSNQTVSFNIPGTPTTSTANGTGLCAKPVQVWSSDFAGSGDSAGNWMQSANVSDPNCQITNFPLTKGYVYTFTTNSLSPGAVGSRPTPKTTPASAAMQLPYPASSATDALATPGTAGLCYNNSGEVLADCGQCSTIQGTCISPCQNASGQLVACDDEPQYLDAQDGSFELVSCQLPNGTTGTCTEQTTVGEADKPGPQDPTCGDQGANPYCDTASGEPVFWHPYKAGVQYPYAIIGDGSWQNYTIGDWTEFGPGSTASPVTSTGLISYFTNRFVTQDDSSHDDIGQFDGYVFDVASDGTWQLDRNSTADGSRVTLDSTALSNNMTAPVRATGWNQLSLSMHNSGSSVIITASVNGKTVVSCKDTTSDSLGTPPTGGLGGVEAGLTNHFPTYLAANSPHTVNFPQALYSGLSVTPAPAPAGTPAQCPEMTS